MGRKKPVARDDENPVAASVGMQGGGGGKSKKKGRIIDDDEYSVGTELPEDMQKQDDKLVDVITGKKKGKKGSSKNSQYKDEDQEGSSKNTQAKDEDQEEDEDYVRPIVKKKSKSKKGGNSLFSSFGLLEDEEDGESGLAGDKDEGDISEGDVPRKKSTSLFTASTFGAIDDEEGEHKTEDDEAPVAAFTGKKKSSNSNKKGGSGSVFVASTIAGLDEEEEGMDETKEEEGEAISITFSGKKKSSKGSKKTSNINTLALVDEECGDDIVDGVDTQDEDSSVISFSGKKKSSKKKTISVSTATSSEAGPGNEVADVVESKQLSVGTSNIEADDSKIKKQEDLAEASKNKKKKKKGGRTAQEEDDLDKILAELGQGPSIAKPAVPEQEEKVQVQPEPIGVVEAKGEKEAEEEGVESAAAKKKKKKKEKEKEKKAAAAAAVATEVKEEKQESKTSDKKMSKKVREMQEALARRKEAEERKKKEEEEKLRKEEEERRRQEELEKQAEDARRRKKEREKEKLLKKKQEGKLLTAKQKEEARRREAMLNQILAKSTVPLESLPAESAPTKKRPIYKNTKKSKASTAQANGSAPVNDAENKEAKESQQESVAEAITLESHMVKEAESTVVEDISEVAKAIEENGVEKEEVDDNDGGWDEKSWDDADLKLPNKGAFSDEEVDSEPEPVVKKEIKNALSALTLPSTKVTPINSQDVESRISQPHEVTGKNRRKEATAKKAAQKSDALPKQGEEEDLRSPICCIMGHVDTGKTKLLDCIRGTNVQEGEAGGITQQIGATYFPAENIRERTKELKADAKLKVPGLLVIDTPGHESFNNLRSRGSGLCDIAILVVDIMHGLEPQTIESLNLLKMRNTEFIVALNKVDRLYGWKTCRNAPIKKAMKQQTKDVQNEFDMRLTQIVTQFKEQGLNTELYYKNPEWGEVSNIVPTSAISGEGIPDLLLLLVQWTQKTMVEKLTFSNEVQCVVLEVKVVEGHGTTIDVVLINGVLHEGDQIIVCGMQGPIVTTIRALLTPHPMKELRVKGSYLHHKEIKAAQGIKITAQGLEHAVAGTGLYVVGPDDDLDDVKESAMEDMKTVMSRIDKSGEGVCVQASTLGSLEALLEFLKTPVVSIPVSGISIGPVHKKDVMKASVMLEKKKEYAAILAFDVKVTPEARELADEYGVKIFIADIIYHLFDQFKAYIDNLKEEKKREAADEAVFPCVLKIMPNCIFNKKDPIVLGVDVVEGIAKVGTPICIPTKEFIDIGRIASIENNHKPVDFAKKGQKVAIKIVGSNSEEQQKMFGRHFEIDDELVSHITRNSIDVLKANYRADLHMDDWKLLVKLKNLFKIQ